MRLDERSKAIRSLAAADSADSGAGQVSSGAAVQDKHRQLLDIRLTGHHPPKRESSRRMRQAQITITVPKVKVSTLIAISTITPPVSGER